MRVAVLAEWYPSPGDPVHGVWAHRQAVAARDAGADVRVIAARRPIPPLSAARRGPGEIGAWLRDVRGLLSSWELDGIEISTVPFLSPPRPLSYGTWGHWMAPSVMIALERLRARWPFELVHAHSVTPPGYAAAAWTRRRPAVALAVSTHGPDVINVPSRSRAAMQATRSTLLRADLLIANSRWAVVRCEELAGRSLPTEVVHLGADPPSATATATTAPGRRSRPTVVTLAHLVARKRHIVVLHALAALPAEERPDYLIIGDGPGREPLAAAAAQLGVADRVQMVGQLDNDRAREEVARCHLFVMPSVDEPFGVAYAEAMAAGLPAIATRGEGGPEDIAAAGPGMVLVGRDDHRAVAEAIAAALREPVALAALGEQARRTATCHFSWKRCGERTAAAYRRALEEHERAGRP